MQSPPTPRASVRITNRLRAILIHIPWYSIEGNCRLAADCGASRSSISRLVRHRSSPSYALARAVTEAVGRRLGKPVDIRELFSTDGTFPTPCVCHLTRDCTGCFPPEAYDSAGNLLPQYHGLQPGDWCRYPPLDT
jgi:transcriptional regulator with XRE-family HTH domain